MEFVVIKIGGEVVDNDHYLDLVVDECAALCRGKAYMPLIVHGGGTQISTMSDKLGIRPEFQDGLRLTTAAEMDIVEMVLSGSVNSSLVRALGSRGVAAVGVSGVSAGLLTADPIEDGAEADKPRDAEADSPRETDADKPRETFTARDARCNPGVLRALSPAYTPVVAPIGSAPAGRGRYNVNADTAAAAIARSLNARLLFITDVPGVLDDSGAVIRHLRYADYERLARTGVIRGGMRAKVSACFHKRKPCVENIAVGMLQNRGDMLLLAKCKIGTNVQCD